ncbi:MAG: cytosine permease, partial [Dehalobacterium sp.]
FWDIFLATAGWAIATWCYVQGGTIGQMVGLKQLLTGTFFGMTLGGLLLALCTVISTRHGIDLWLYQRAVFGVKGATAVFIFCIMTTWGYESINARLFAHSIIKIFKTGGIIIPEGAIPWIGMICCISGWWIAIRGPVAVRMATRIMVPSLFLVGSIIIYLVFSQYSFADLAAITPLYARNYDSPLEPYMMVMEWNLAFVFAWYACLGVLPRLVRTERQSYWGHLGGLATMMACFICIGAMTSLVMFGYCGVEDSQDPTEWLLILGGTKLGLLSLIFIGIANITTQACSLYTISVSTKIINPKWDYKKIVTIWAIWIAILMIWGGTWDYYQTFLAFAGVICGPGIIMIIVDYFIIRKQSFSVRSIFGVKGANAYTYNKGFNIPSFIAFCAGIVAYFAVYDPINLIARSPIFLYTTATGFSMIVSGLVYWGLSMIKPVNEFLTKDRKEITSFSHTKA